jgi:hypothetical protein
MVEKARQAEQTESRSPWITEPHRCAPLVRFILVGQEEANFRHASRYIGATYRELLSRCCGQVYATKFRDVKAEPNCGRTAIEQTSLRCDVKALDYYIDNGPRTDGIARGVGDLSETEPH